MRASVAAMQRPARQVRTATAAALQRSVAVQKAPPTVSALAGSNQRGPQKIGGCATCACNRVRGCKTSSHA